MSYSDQLPVYPSNIQGELRLILQNKDLFLLCYKYLEDYRRLSEEQNRIITKEFIEEQIHLGEDEIEELRKEQASAEVKLAARIKHNESLLGQLSMRGMMNYTDTARKMFCRSPNLRRCPKLVIDMNVPTSDLTLFENIALAIEEIQKEIRDKLKPLCEFLRDLFYLQLHFALVLTQVCNYCMPLITENIGLIDRIFFWTDRPEFELIRKSGEISDRLKDIYTRTQTVLTLLVENVLFLQNKVELQKNLEKKFQERLEIQQIERDAILRKIHNIRQELDLIDEDNDRLVGSLVKLDPKYVGSDQFNEFADYTVRRNYAEGRLTPEGFHLRQPTLNTPPPPPQQYIGNFSAVNINSMDRNQANRGPKTTPRDHNFDEKLTDNTNNPETNRIKHSHHHKSRKKRTKHDKEHDKENIKKTRKSKHRKEDRHRSHNFEVTDNFQSENPETKAVSIREKIINKTKGIFDTAFKKPPDNTHKTGRNHKPKTSSKDYVKVFEGEILAELNQLSSINNEPTAKPLDPWDVSTKSLSMERSLQKKYQMKQSEIFSSASNNNNNGFAKRKSNLEYFHRTKDEYKS